VWKIVASLLLWKHCNEGCMSESHSETTVPYFILTIVVNSKL